MNSKPDKKKRDRDIEFMDYIYDQKTPFRVMDKPGFRPADMKAAMDYAAKHPTEHTILTILRLAEQYRCHLEDLGAEPQSLETTAWWVRKNMEKEGGDTDSIDDFF